MKYPFEGKSFNWLVTGAAGFIGSHLVENLLRLGQKVVGLDNFSTGKRENLDQVKTALTPEQWERFSFIEGDVTDPACCKRACTAINYVLHEAALGSVPQSIEDPLKTHNVNITGHLNMLMAARDAGVQRFVYASSSAIYGDDPVLPKKEENLGRLLSPYALSKLVDEMWSDIFTRIYGLETIGLRYFNVFGPRQDPNGAYAAVIPKWVSAMIKGEDIILYGTGETSRDFCHVSNVVQANLLAATTSNPGAVNKNYNIAFKKRTTLLELFALLKNFLMQDFPQLKNMQPVRKDFRAGDILHSYADIELAQKNIGYDPECDVERGLAESIIWYKNHMGR